MKGNLRSLSMLVVGVAALFILNGCALVGIEDGETGVKADFGKISETPLTTGWHFYIPGISWVEIWNVKTQEEKETAAVPSSEGLISTLDVSVLFNTPVNNVVGIRKTIGREYQNTVLNPYIREAIRNVASGYPAKALYSDEGRNKISQNIQSLLKEKLEPRGIMIQDVLLRDVKLPRVFSDSIEQKLKTEQESLQKQFELEKAQKDAEILIAKAKGVAESNKIISASLTENYLRYRWIEGLQTGVSQVIYVPTEANMPIMEAARLKVDLTK